MHRILLKTFAKLTILLSLHWSLSQFHAGQHLTWKIRNSDSGDCDDGGDSDDGGDCDDGGDSDCGDCDDGGDSDDGGDCDDGGVSLWQLCG